VAMLRPAATFRSVIAISAALLCACADATPEPETSVSPPNLPDSTPPPSYCESTLGQAYDPEDPGFLGALPDDWFTSDDPESPTGLRVTLHDHIDQWLEDFEPLVQDAYTTLDGLDGWGTSAPIMIRFEDRIGPLPEGWDESLTSESVQLWMLGDAPERIPYAIEEIDDGLTLMVQPLRTMHSRTRHGLVITRELRAQSGACLAPSETLRHLLEGNSVTAQVSRLQDGYARLLEVADLTPGDVSAAVVFTTQTGIEGTVAARDDAFTRSIAWTTPPDCSGETIGDTVIKHCERHYQAWDYRPVFAGASDVPVATEIPVSIWFPSTGEGLRPTVLFGHGLGDDRLSGIQMADMVHDLGIIVIASDAIKHGDHPTADHTDQMTGVLAFLGIDLPNARIDPDGLRENFRQTGLERLQLGELLHLSPDLDEDGVDDVDTSHLVYVGASLGAIMGSQVLALDSRYEAGVLLMPGGQLTGVLRYASVMDNLAPVISQVMGTEDEFLRLLGVVQAAMDPGDPLSYARHVLEARIDDADGPHLLATMVLNDDTVPNETTRPLAHTLGTPIVGPVVWTMDGLEVLDPGPGGAIAANGPQGRTTGLFQYDRMTKNGEIRPASHANMPLSPESRYQLRHFATTLFETGTPEIIDPYDALGTPPLTAP
jgi:hypothetical protein